VHFTNSSSDHSRSVTFAAIAGVTRKVLWTRTGLQCGMKEKRDARRSRTLKGMISFHRGGVIDSTVRDHLYG
jgi:hypothetical protein